MAVVAQLNTVFTGDTSKFEAATKRASKSLGEFDSATKKLGPGFGTAVDGMLGRLNSLSTALRKLKPLMELGFGFGIGTQVFQMVHQGIVDIASGFNEAQKAGLGFSESLADGAKNALGMETAVQRMQEQLANTIAGMKSIEKVEGILDPSPAMFPNVSGADAKLGKLQAARDEAMAAAAPSRREIAGKKTELSQYRMVGEDFRDEGRIAEIEAELKAMENKHGILLMAEENAIDAVAEFEKKMSDLNSAIDRHERPLTEAEVLQNEANAHRDKINDALAREFASMERQVEAAKAQEALLAKNKKALGFFPDVFKAVADKGREMIGDKAKGIIESTKSPAEVFQKKLDDLTMLKSVGAIDEKTFQRARMSEFSAMAGKMPDPNRKAAALEFGTAADFSARNADQRQTTEKDILAELKRQTTIQDLQLKAFAEGGVVPQEI